MELSKDLRLAVSVFQRTKEETFPSLKKYSLVAQENNSVKEANVKMERLYAEVDDPD